MLNKKKITMDRKMFITLQKNWVSTLFIFFTNYLKSVACHIHKDSITASVFKGMSKPTLPIERLNFDPVLPCRRVQALSN